VRQVASSFVVGASHIRVAVPAKAEERWKKVIKQAMKLIKMGVIFLFNENIWLTPLSF
jgi:ribosome recycling factor